MLPEQLKHLTIGRKEFTFDVRKGKAVSVKTWSESNISSRTQSNLYGQTWVAGIASREVEITEVFVQEESGREFSERFYNSPVSIREGNQIAIVYTEGVPIAVVNYNQEKYWYFPTEGLLKKVQADKDRLGKSFLLVMGLSFAAIYALTLDSVSRLLNSHPLLMLILFVVLPFILPSVIFQKNWKKTRQHMLVSHIKKITAAI